jgi:hypothetical protein
LLNLKPLKRMATQLTLVATRHSNAVNRLSALYVFSGVNLTPLHSQFEL